VLGQTELDQREQIGQSGFGSLVLVGPVRMQAVAATPVTGS